MEYKQRIILFLDLLGFREIVNKTVDLDFLTQIYEVLQSITSDTIATETFNQLHREISPKRRLQGEDLYGLQKSLDEISEHYKKVARETKIQSTLAVTHFSDSIVISVDIEDLTAIKAMMTLTAKINYRLWEDYGILTRGGITIGQLIHEEGGVLIGPAMVRAYELESTLAKNPRILIDENCIDFIKKEEFYQDLKFLYKDVGALENIPKRSKLSKGLEINLATSYEYLQNGPYSNTPTVMKRYDRSLQKAVPRLKEIRETIQDEDVIKKYNYIIGELEAYTEGYNFWDEC